MSHASSSPICRLVDLSDLSQGGLDTEIETSAAERGAIADWAGVSAVHVFTATVSLRKLSSTRFSMTTAWRAEVEQPCVVTLEPVISVLEQTIRRELHYLPHPPETGGELTLAAGDDETPDSIESLHYDMAAPLLEEFSLALDPYPRKAGVHFEAPAEAPDAADNPFAVLNALKEKK